MSDEHDYLFERVRIDVIAGYHPVEVILARMPHRVADELGAAPPELVEALKAHAVRLFAEQEIAERSWTERTVNDAIDDAFHELDESGIVALQNAGYTMSDGWGDVNHLATLRAEEGNQPRGATFFHGQDVERALRGGGLQLAFGAYEDDDAKHDAASVAIAKEIVAVLAEHGVRCEWDGSVDRRIKIPAFEWRKRQATSAPTR